MNLHKGLNRIFILIGLAAAVFGCILGKNFAESELIPSHQEAFQSINWNDQENINKYYLEAKEIEESETAWKKDDQSLKIGQGRGFADIHVKPLFRTVFTENLPNYKKSPPQYNSYVFKRTFPNALKTPVYKVWVSIILGALLVFCLCYGGLHSIRLVIKWIIGGFKDK